MPTLEVSEVSEVLERLRSDVVSYLQAQGIQVPQQAREPGACHEAVLAYQRLMHRRLEATPRTVARSPELRKSCRYPRFFDAIEHIRAELEHGDDMTQRLTRYFFRSGFNDFLFNNFGIHHFHLGPRNAALDKTGKHPMAAGAKDLLFAWVTPTEAYLLDVLDHDVFDDAEETKKLIQTALRGRPEFVRQHVAPNVVGADQSFEEAFELARSGFVTCYEIDGYFFLTGGTVMDGTVRKGLRGPCTSAAVVDATNHVLNQIVRLVEYLRNNRRSVQIVLASASEESSSSLSLEVVEFGPAVVLRDRGSGVEFIADGERRGYRLPGTSPFRQLPS